MNNIVLGYIHIRLSYTRIILLIVSSSIHTGVGTSLQGLGNDPIRRKGYTYCVLSLSGIRWLVDANIIVKNIDLLV